MRVWSGALIAIAVAVSPVLARADGEPVRRPAMHMAASGFDPTPAKAAAPSSAKPAGQSPARHCSRRLSADQAEVLCGK